MCRGQQMNDRLRRLTPDLWADLVGEGIQALDFSHTRKLNGSVSPGLQAPEMLILQSESHSCCSSLKLGS